MKRIFMKKTLPIAFALMILGSLFGLTSCAVDGDYSDGSSGYDALDESMDEQQELEERLAAESGCSS